MTRVENPCLLMQSPFINHRHVHQPPWPPPCRTNGVDSNTFPSQHVTFQRFVKCPLCCMWHTRYRHNAATALLRSETHCSKWLAWLTASSSTSLMVKLVSIMRSIETTDKQQKTGSGKKQHKPRSVWKGLLLLPTDKLSLPTHHGPFGVRGWCAKASL